LRPPATPGPDIVIGLSGSTYDAVLQNTRPTASSNLTLLRSSGSGSRTIRVVDPAVKLVPTGSISGLNLLKKDDAGVLSLLAAEQQRLHGYHDGDRRYAQDISDQRNWRPRRGFTERRVCRGERGRASAFG
jgi:hypothetical protein